jgi:hypothetical protein
MIVVEKGTWRGAPIRKARKAGRCDYWRGAQAGGMCAARIAPGDFYMQGEMNDTAGGWGSDRYCMDCAGPEAREALATALEREKP